MTELRAHVNRLVDAAARKHDALAVGILADGETSFHLRRATESSLFEIGSITKPFTGVLLADMFLAGEVDLVDPITEYLPADRLPRWKERPATLEELATHHASLPNVPHGLGRKELAFALGLRGTDPWAGLDVEAYRANVRATSPRRAPGSRFRYSSLGFGLLGDALAARAGLPYEQLLAERICAPLGLGETAISPSPEQRTRLLEGRSRRGRPRPPLHDLIAAAGAIRSSARDLLDFVIHSLAPPESAPGPALRLAAQPRLRLNRRLSLGLGWMIIQPKGKPTIVGHNGGTWGFRSFAAMSPTTGHCVVVLANTARSVDRLGLKLVELISSEGRGT